VHLTRKESVVSLKLHFRTERVILSYSGSYQRSEFVFRLLHGLPNSYDTVARRYDSSDRRIHCGAGSTHPSISFAIVIGPMAKSLPDAFAPWAYVTSQRRRDRHGRMDMLNG
jgi:hypothetical protein